MMTTWKTGRRIVAERLTARATPLEEFVQAIGANPPLRVSGTAVFMTAQTRGTVPSGYGLQEQCLPFTAASALGFVIPSPIAFGVCVSAELPEGCRAFRSPLDRPLDDGQFSDARVFYIVDDAEAGRVVVEALAAPPSREGLTEEGTR